MTSTQPSPDKIILGKYQLGRLLGTGRGTLLQNARSHHARSLADDKSVAIKLIDKHKTDPSIYPRIVGEVNAMCILDHPNVLHIHEVVASKHKIYLVMELVKGGDLSTKLSCRPGHRFPEPIARRLVTLFIMPI